MPRAASEGVPLDAVDPSGAESAAKAGWDPEGLFSGVKPLAPAGMDFFEQRAQRRAAEAAALQVSAPQAAAVGHASGSPPSSGQPPAAAVAPQAPAAIPQMVFDSALRPAPAAGGVPGGEQCAGYEPAEFDCRLRDQYMPVWLQHPGLRVLHLDPPVMTVDAFAPPELCERLMAAARASGCMRASRIGAGNAASASNTAYDQRRTSSSVMVDTTMQQQYPELGELLRELQRLGRGLMDPDGVVGAWGAPGRMPAPGQYCYESAQVACYTEGQHFLEHEDGFPSIIARSNAFQRHATLLLYLNDVPKGGHTRFNHLQLSVQPQQGKALLFFPAFSNGRPDERTLHTAEDAQDDKWVMQQWVARGWVQPSKAASATATPTTMQSFVLPSEQSAGKAPRASKQKGKAKKGFGK